jgi:hypothetical protein
MLVPKQEIYEALQGVTDNVYQNRPETLSKFPCLTFSMVDNVVTMSMGKEIGRQDIEFSVDVFTQGADASLEATSLLQEVENTLRALGYRLVYSADVPDPDDNVIHISTRFNLVG